MADQGKLKVRIPVGIPVTGKMFGAAQHAGGVQAPFKRCNEIRNGLRSIAPCPHIDHRVVWIAVHIADRCENPVEATPFRLIAGGSAVALRQVQRPLRVSAMEPAQSHRWCQPGGSVESLADAFFHVGT